jgi:endoglucanase
VSTAIQSGPSVTGTTSETTLTVPGKIEAESFSEMSGIQTQSTTDTNGGLNVGWIGTGDWMDYVVDVDAAGSYIVEYRVASPVATGQIQLKSEASVLATTYLPITGGYQTWTSVAQTVELEAGVQTIRVYAGEGGFNLNWLNFTPSQPAVHPGKVEAESYVGMYGIQTQTTTDAGGGLNVGWVNTGDWMDYIVNVATTGSYTMEYRVASNVDTGQIQLKSGETVLATTNVPITGGNQTWSTVSETVELTAGAQTIRVYASGGGFNLNWFNVTST